MGHKDRELFEQRWGGWMGSLWKAQPDLSSTGNALGIQEGISARQDHHTLIEPEEKDPIYTSPGLDNRCNRTPPFHPWGHERTGCPSTRRHQ